MSPETKKTLIYGGVISFAVGAGLYIWSRYEDQKNGSAAPASQQTDQTAQAQADAAAAAQEASLAQLASFSSAQLAPVSLGTEAPHDDFSAEIAAILKAVNPAPPASTTPTTPQPPNPPTTVTDGSSHNPPKAVGPIRDPKSTLLRFKVASTGDY